MIRSSRLIGNAAVSVVQTVISGVVLFLLYRYLLDHLGSAQLGLWSVILASTSVARLSDLGLTGSVVKFVSRYRALKNDEQASAVVQTAAISIALVMTGLVLAIYPLLDVVLKLVVPAADMPQAASLLPWAVLSLWLGSVGGVFQSGLDGCHRMALRNILMIVANLLYFGAALWLVPHYGLLGLAFGQIAQAVLLMLLSWIALRRELSFLPLVPVYWSKKVFREIFGYAVNFQINSIAVLLFDPLTKLLMSKYGGLSSAAYYEMASQLVVKLRALLISANQALVPEVAELHETSPHKLQALYLKTYRLVFFLSAPFYAAILVALPAISMLWIGRIEEQFLLFGALLAAGWGFNNVTGPAYFFNFGTGDLKWNSISHVLMAVLNVLFGLVLGPVLGGLGVAIGAMTALAIASYFLVNTVHKRYGIPVWNIIPAEHYVLLTAVVCGVSVSFVITRQNPQNVSFILTQVIGLGVYAVIVTVAMYLHPYRKLLIQTINSWRLTRQFNHG